MANTMRNYMLTGRALADDSDFSILTNAYEIRWGLRLNKAGYLDVVLPARDCQVNPNLDNAYTLDDFDQDYQIDLFRIYGASYDRRRVGPGPFLVTSIELDQRDDGLRVINLHAETALSVLSRRINPYDGEDPRSDWPPVSADDFAKDMVRNNFLANASSHGYAGSAYSPDPLRDASSLLSVQTNLSLAAPNYEPDVENAEILRAIQAAADYSWANGIAMFFDIFYVGGAVPFEFRTMINAYATDRSVPGPGQITLQADLDLSAYKVGFDWSGSSNRVYAGARGSNGAARTYAISPAIGSGTTNETDLINSVGINPFSLREKFESSSAEDAPGTQSDADSALVAANSVFRADGTIAVNGRYRYGIDFAFGDKLNFVVEGTLYPGYITSEVGSVQENGSEKLTVNFSTEPLPRQNAQGIAGVLSDLSRVTTNLEKLSRIER